MANTLFLWLEGPMQSWGERARWSTRDSAAEPTKSGIVGLLACALGQSLDEDLRELSRQIHVGIRCDRPGTLLKDYQTVLGPWGTQLSDRYYLCDASFLAAIQSDRPDLIEQLAYAIQHPVWPYFLGRKSCPPARPLYGGVGEYVSMQAALESVPLVQNRPDGSFQIRCVIESTPSAGVLRRDEIDSRSRRTYLPRFTQSILIVMQASTEDSDVSISTDA